MLFDVAALAAREIFQLAARRVKGLSDRHRQLLFRMPVNHQFSAGHAQMDAYVKGPALMVMPQGGGLDRDLAAADAIIIVVEGGGLFP